MEYKQRRLGVCVLARESMMVRSVSADEVTVTNDDGSVESYHITKFMRSNQGTCIDRVLVDRGERIQAGQVIADGPATSNGEISLGKIPLIGFMTWKVITPRRCCFNQ